MTAAPRIIASFVVLLASGACVHHQAIVPGVLDMRTDGSLAKRGGAPRGTASERLDPAVARSGVDGMIQGNGVSVNGSVVTIEDRHYWLVGMVPVYNDDPRPELTAAEGITGAMIDVEIGEDYSAFDIIGGLVARTVVPITAWITPSWTFVARGTLVDVGRHEPLEDEATPMPDPDAVPPPLSVLP